MKKLDKNCACFLAQASHDLRQPLQALMLYLDLFDTSELSPKQKKLWNKILKTTGSLKILLSNVLDFSKFEFGDIKVNKTNVNMGILLSDLGQEYTMLAEAKNLNFEYSICNCFVYTDAVLLERILRNLIANAFKFTKDKIEVFCKENDTYITIDVKDNGIGIEKDEQSFIFDEFFQGSNACLLNNDGAGLGLAIVKKIADKLEIKISVTSVKNEGANFSVSIKKRLSLS